MITRAVEDSLIHSVLQDLATGIVKKDIINRTRSHGIHQLMLQNVDVLHTVSVAVLCQSNLVTGGFRHRTAILGGSV
jgi:hypothetical protein